MSLDVLFRTNEFRQLVELRVTVLALSTVRSRKRVGSPFVKIGRSRMVGWLRWRSGMRKSLGLGLILASGLAVAANQKIESGEPAKAAKLLKNPLDFIGRRPERSRIRIIISFFPGMLNSRPWRCIPPPSYADNVSLAA